MKRERCLLFLSSYLFKKILRFIMLVFRTWSNSVFACVIFVCCGSVLHVLDLKISWQLGSVDCNSCTADCPRKLHCVKVLNDM
jgi:hypothetical protein